MGIFDEFTEKYSVIKTLRFALKPIRETRQKIEESESFNKDEERAEDYKKAKKIIDEYHKYYIEEQLKQFSFTVIKDSEDKEISLTEISKKIEEIKKRKVKIDKQLDKMRDTLRKQIASCFDSKKDTSPFGKNFIKERLLKWLEEKESDRSESIEIIKKFNKWITYFEGFNNNRENIYTHRDISTSIAHRVVHVNLPLFLDNMTRYEKARNLGIDFGEIKSEKEMCEIFTLEHFNQCLNQSGIDNYNVIIGGKTLENGKKIKGVNEIINLSAQESESEAKEISSCKMNDLKKQILSDRSSQSFILSPIENDKELCDAIQVHNNDLFYDNITKKLETVFQNLEEAKPADIYIRNDKAIMDVSKSFFGDKDEDKYIIKDALEYYAREIKFKDKKGKKLETEIEKWIKKTDYFSFEEIHKGLEEYSKYCCQENMDFNEKIMKTQDVKKCLYEYFASEKITLRMDDICKSYSKVLPVLNEDRKEGITKALSQNEESVDKIRNYLDSISRLQRFLKPLYISIKKDKDKEKSIYEKDSSFYSDFDKLYESLESIISLYNRTRNYLTQKEYRKEKYKLNFDKVTFANGWDKERETANLCTILLKDNNYYLGVMHTEHNKIFINCKPGDAKEEEVYRKMEYRQIPNSLTMLPKIFFSEKNKEIYEPSEQILKIRNHSTHTKNGEPKDGFEKEDFNLEDCHAMIDFFKKSIKKNKDWDMFNYRFSETETYKDISEFYGEVDRQSYNLDFVDISADYIHECVRKGELYLFQIYSKDFSEKTRGKPNLQTLYWKSIFDERNIKNVIYKLDGGAELFYRKESLNYNQKIWAEGHHHRDKKQDYPIIKDRRYAKEQFLFHVPITCNFCCNDKSTFDKSAFNNEVNETLRKNAKDVHFIGIDRGERHLAYYTLLDPVGKILEQGSLNDPLGNKDYTSYWIKKRKAVVLLENPGRKLRI